MRYHLMLTMEDSLQILIILWEDIRKFLLELAAFLIKTLHIGFIRVEQHKGIVVSALYRHRGKWSQRLTHWGMGSIAALGVMIAPVISQEFPGTSINPWQVTTVPAVLSASTQDPGLDTEVSSKVRDSIINYTIQSGDTVSSIANKFGVSPETVRWQNKLTNDKIKVGDALQILPVTGVAHKVQKGDTVYSIAKKYDAEPQAIVDFPFNTFSNDETLELAIGQTVIVPEGVMPKGLEATPRPKQITPNAGTVVASGRFVWPTQGIITQRFSWYHPGLDIANPALPMVVAADAGTVVFAGWDGTGYGNMVLIDHGNGFRTRYGHMSKIMVVSGQTVQRGGIVGKMGSTGRSTGPHLHFEIYQNGVRVSPFNYLK